jgi:hypothetical protein
MWKLAPWFGEGKDKSFFGVRVDSNRGHSGLGGLGLKRLSSVKTLRKMSGHPWRIFPA